MSVGVGELVGTRTPPFANARNPWLARFDVAWSTENDVLKGLELEVHSGQITALVGRSGSGKSTLAHVIHGLLPRDSQPRISALSVSSVRNWSVRASPTLELPGRAWCGSSPRTPSTR